MCGRARFSWRSVQRARMIEASVEKRTHNPAESCERSQTGGRTTPSALAGRRSKGCLVSFHPWPSTPNFRTSCQSTAGSGFDSWAKHRTKVRTESRAIERIRQESVYLARKVVVRRSTMDRERNTLRYGYLVPALVLILAMTALAQSGGVPVYL